ncbi:3-oxoadipyl-CoA thiolase [Futiania mangrovi]|uniref:Beta-ketoadipyl-CoA thiolase n=1 Tax=Futiania mangrovi TaxID=2959716 RepID=A0A9J6PAB9_9PROT|nr:3-oxoadipyl-CoA thiolase [Futiania mangrovii]MCP1335345.1 3-oxoadipyl-CoA thiolase [Futiania mangrovii]
MAEAFICDAARTPIGRHGGSLAQVRTDDLGVVPLKALIDRNPDVDWGAVDDVIYGCVTQAGEDSRNVARNVALLAGLSTDIPGVTVNRLCGSSMEAAVQAARAIRTGDAELVVVGGVESMSRAPYVMGKATEPFSRNVQMFDTTIGWRFPNPVMAKKFGLDAMPETAENVAEQFQISREDQDRFAAWSQAKAVAAQENGRLAKEIVPVLIPQRKGDPIVVDKDEHPRAGTTVDKLAKLGTPFRKEGGTVTAGNASGVNDGAVAMIVASEAAVKKYGLTPRARLVAGAVAGVEPRIMGIGPAPASDKLLKRLGLKTDDLDVIEMNEAFAAQVLASARMLGIADDDPRVNRNGGAIALGHPLGMSGARLIMTAVQELQETGGNRALCTMCIGIGQGIATVVERV